MLVLLSVVWFYPAIVGLEVNQDRAVLSKLRILKWRRPFAILGANHEDCNQIGLV